MLIDLSQCHVLHIEVSTKIHENLCLISPEKTANICVTFVDHKAHNCIGISNIEKSLKEPFPKFEKKTAYIK